MVRYKSKPRDTNHANGQSWVHERRGWQIVIGRSVKVLPEDVPEAVAQGLPRKGGGAMKFPRGMVGFHGNLWP